MGLLTKNYGDLPAEDLDVLGIGVPVQVEVRSGREPRVVDRSAAVRVDTELRRLDSLRESVSGAGRTPIRVFGVGDERLVRGAGQLLRATVRGKRCRQDNG